MGMHPMRNPENCPNCGRSLSQDPKPENVQVKNFPAEVTYATDPACGGRWHVWDKTSPLRHKAQKYVDGED